MNGIIVARRPCGCVVAAALQEYADMNDDILGWLRDGYSVALEQRERIGFERCAKHIGMTMAEVEAASHVALG